jgi:hypothetical protein
VTSDHGNLAAIVESSTAPDEPVAGWDDAVGIASANLAPRAPWVDGDDLDDRGLAARANPLVALPLLAALVVLAWRRRARDDGRLAVLALLGIAAGVVATTRITGILVPYLVRWWWGMGAIAALAVLAAVSGSLPRRAVVVGGLATALLVTGRGLRGLPAAIPEGGLSRAVGGVLPVVLAALDPDERYIVRGFDRRTLDGNGVGLFAALERRGLHVFRERERDARITYGGWRLADDDDVDAVVSIVSVEDLERDWQSDPRDRLIVRWAPPGARGHAVFVHPTR